MNWAYMHLVFNHFPIIGVLIGIMLLLAGIFLNNEGIKISGLGTISFAAVMSLVAYLTGDSAENVVKELPEVAESLISRHEDIATISMYLIIPSGLLSSLTLYSIWKKEKSVLFLMVITLVLSLLSSVALIYAGRTGGQIRHSEFRSDSSKQYIIDHQYDAKEED